MERRNKMSEGTFSIRVINDGGDGVEGIKVCCFFGLTHGFSEESTDEDGWARFDVPTTAMIGSTISVKSIYVDDTEVSDEHEYLEDGDTRSFTI